MALHQNGKFFLAESINWMIGKNVLLKYKAEWPSPYEFINIYAMPGCKSLDQNVTFF